MKKVLKNIFILLIVFSSLIPTNIKATASGALSLYANSLNIYVGQSVTVTGSVTANSNSDPIYMIVGNVSSSNNSVLSGGGQFNKRDINGFKSCSWSFTFTANSIGAADIVMSTDNANTISVEGEYYNLASKSIRINVIKKTSSSGTGSSGGTSGSLGGGSTSRPSEGSESTNTSEEEVVDVTLKSLSVSEGKLTPAFNPNQKEYEVEVGNKVDKVEIKAEANDANAQVVGAKEITLKDTETKAIVKVTNEDENNEYTITFIKETPAVTVGGYGILNEFRDAEILEGFEDYKIQIDGVDVMAKKNPANNIVVVYALDKNSQKSYYIYNEKNNEITSIYKPIALLGNKYVMISIPKKYKDMEGFKFGKVKIGEQEFEGWTFKDKEFKGYSLVYLMDQYGKEHLYQYEESEQVLQIYNGSAPITNDAYNTLSEELKMYQMFTYILAATSGIIGVSALTLAISVKKKRRK